MQKRFLITGGAGFIGSAVVRRLIGQTGHHVMVVDKLTYAGNLESLVSVASDPRYSFQKIDICDALRIKDCIEAFQPDVVMHLAAESHVDRSIDGPGAFIQTNIVGTYTLLEATLSYWKELKASRKESFRFHHISTDEVFGSLGPTGLFSETTAYQPNSPYSASKAASDHLVRAWGHTYGLPVIVSNCSNNYGPYHFPEKLVPLMILNALEGKPLPVYGDGSNVRDWLYVDDHAAALLLIATHGVPHESYNVGGENERTNLQVVETICELMDRFAPDSRIGPRSGLIRFVTDRPGHDQRYAIDASKLVRQLGWRAEETFETGLEKTVRWYLANSGWWERIRSGVYQGERLGAVS